MPYLKFASEKEREKATDISFALAEENDRSVQGLIAVVRDPSHGKIDFYSEKPYLEIFDKKGIRYEIIPKEQISAPYASALRSIHPAFADEL